MDRYCKHINKSKGTNIFFTSVKYLRVVEICPKEIGLALGMAFSVVCVASETKVFGHVCT